MEKGLICLALLVMVIFSNCKKEGKPQDDQYIDGWTRVLGVHATDTSSTKYVNGRVQTLALATDEDSQLKAELIGYLPLPGGQGQYTIQMTNKTTCQMILRWNWDKINPVDYIEPLDSTAGTPESDVIKAGQVKIYRMVAMAVPGTIFVKSQNINSTCNPSSQLKLIITPAILPIEFTKITRKRTGNQVTVNWSTETPGDVDHFLVMWTPTGDQKDEVCKYMLASNPNRKDYSVTYQAVKKETK